MSIEAAMSRMAQIQSMFGSGVVPTAEPAKASPTAFSSALASATATPPPAAGTSTDFASLASGTPAPSTSASALPSSVPYANEITQAAKANGVDPALLAGLIKQESGFNPNAGSGAGARGLTQLMPGTAAGLGVTNVLDPVQSINA